MSRRVQGSGEVSRQVAAKATRSAAPAKAPAEQKRGRKSDGFEPKLPLIAPAPPPHLGEASAPALTRALFALAQRQGLGEGSADVAIAASRELLRSPEAMATFKQALPWMESNVPPEHASLKLEPARLESLAALGDGVAGPLGRRFIHAAIDGLTSGGGVRAAAAELATASRTLEASLLQKAYASSPVERAPAERALGAALLSLASLVREETPREAQRLARVLQVSACTVGCLLPS